MQPPAAAQTAPDAEAVGAPSADLRLAGREDLAPALESGARHAAVALETPLDALPDAAAVLQQIPSLLAPHGALTVTAANAMSASARLEALRGGAPVRGLTRAALLALLEEAGFVVTSVTRERDPAPLRRDPDVPEEVQRWLLADEEAATTMFRARAVVADEPAQLAAAHAEAEELRRRVAEVEQELRTTRERETALRGVVLDRHEDVMRLEDRVAELKGGPPAASVDIEALRAELAAAYGHIHWMESRRIWRAGRLFWRVKGLLRR